MTSEPPADFTPRDVAAWTGGHVQGPPDTPLRGLESVERAGPSELTFVGDLHWAARWPDSRAAAAVVSADLPLEPGPGRSLIRVDNADLAMARVLGRLAADPVAPAPGTHDTAVVHPTAAVAADARIGPFCVVGPHAQVGPGAVLHAHVTVLDHAGIGEHSVLWPGVVVRERCVVGRHCVLEPHVVLGADGFGYRLDAEADPPRIVKVPHLGHVRLGDAVELGAHTTVDRGKFGATVIGDGSKLDNHCQIGHNVRIGRMVMISGCTAVAGSCVFEDGVVVGGGCRFKDHVHVGAGAQIGGASAVMDDVPPKARWAGFPAQDSRRTFREIGAVRHLPDLLKKVRPLLRRLDDA